MGEATAISWCDHTWNPWRGCERVSPGCDNCYAEEMSHQNPRTLGEWGGPDTYRAMGAEAYMKLPFKWAREARAAGVRRRVFCLSLGDWLEDRPDLDAQRLILLNTIHRTPELDWLLLTKRPENFGPLLRRAMARVSGGCDRFDDAIGLGSAWLCGQPPANVWVLTTVENQECADLRVPLILKIPAVVRGLSVEPMLMEINLRPFIGYAKYKGNIAGVCVDIDGCTWHRDEYKCRDCGWGYPNDPDYPRRVPGIDWVICGAESGTARRPFDLEWARSLRDQCRAAGVAFFMKQDSHRKPGQRGRIEDALWVKEFPVNPHLAGFEVRA
jgi:protein gp37